MWSEPTIFVVDDDPAVQDSLRALLESADFRVETFGTGEAFLEAVDGQHGCVVLDIDLPAMDGLAVMRSLIERHQIQCEATRSGTIHAAHSPKGFADLARRARRVPRP